MAHCFKLTFFNNQVITLKFTYGVLKFHPSGLSYTEITSMLHILNSQYLKITNILIQTVW